MTARELYEALLIELNKVQAPNILLEDFNYFANKAIYQYINKRYNIYDVNQQTTDDIRVLKATAFLDPTQTPYNNYGNWVDSDIDNKFMDATFTTQLPDDYFHILNCVCLYEVKHPYKCYNKGDVFRAVATKLTADTWSQVVDNFYIRPTYKRPYYYIHNVNSRQLVPTNPEGPLWSIHKDWIKNPDEGMNNPEGYWSKKLEKYKHSGTDKEVSITEESEENPRTIISDNSSKSIEDYKKIEEGEDPFKSIDINGFVTIDNNQYPQRNSQVRYGNASKVLMEIRYGQDTSTFMLKKVLVDYIKTPQHIRLTQEQLDRTLDYSQVLEFPDYVCQEIINELVHIIMENSVDQRLQTHPIVTQSIANPVQQQTPQQS